eukprot:3829528-Pyramimonas_sp.AAC.1
MYGDVPGWIQEIGCAELFALLKTLGEKSREASKAPTDCRAVREDYHRGREFFVGRVTSMLA